MLRAKTIQEWVEICKTNRIFLEIVQAVVLVVGLEDGLKETVAYFRKLLDA